MSEPLSWADLSRQAIIRLVKRFPRLKGFFAPILRGRMWTKFSAGVASDALEVDKNFTFDAWKFQVSGFSTVLFKADTDGRKKTQEACVHALFGHMGSPWIPPEYRELLGIWVNPILAFRKFLIMLGIPAAKVTAKDKDAYELFRECVDTLMHLHVIGASKEERQSIYDLFSTREYHAANVLASNLAFFRAIKAEYEREYKTSICFPAYHSFMKEFMVMDYRYLNESDIYDIKEFLHEMIKAHERYLLLLPIEASIPELAAEMQATPWGLEHMYVLNAIALDVQKAFTSLRTDAEFDLGVLDKLDTLRMQLLELYDMLCKATGSSSGPGTADSFLSDEEKLANALEVLGFATDAHPSEKDIAKSYKKFAKMYHPDINKDPGAEALFKKVNEAKEYLVAHYRKK